MFPLWMRLVIDERLPRTAARESNSAPWHWAQLLLKKPWGKPDQVSEVQVEPVVAPLLVPPVVLPVPVVPVVLEVPTQVPEAG
jgi:hypothetical protein